MTDSFRIRRASVGDAPIVSDLGARLFEQTFGPANTPEDMRRYLAGAFSNELQRDELTDPSRDTWLAVDEHDAPIGYVMMRRARAGDGVTFERPAEIQRIYVEASWHGRRVGDALMQTASDHARAAGCDGVWLCVWERNSRAIAFYKRIGFTPVGRALFILGADEQHDVVMSRPIAPAP